jgi:hypothetical protein
LIRYRGRRRRKKADNLQALGFFAILGAALLADGLLALEPLFFGAAVLAGMVLLGGYLIWLSNH